MIVLCTATAVSTAAPEAFFARWADMRTWPQWDDAVVWTRLDGPFAAGATGVLKPRRGPKARFVIETLEPGAEFTDVSTLPGARLRIRHLTAVEQDRRTRVTVEVSIDGPLSGLWALVLRRSVTRSTLRGVRRLADVVEEGVVQETGGGGRERRRRGRREVSPPLPPAPWRRDRRP